MSAKQYFPKCNARGLLCTHRLAFQMICLEREQHFCGWFHSCESMKYELFSHQYSPPPGGTWSWPTPAPPVATHGTSWWLYSSPLQGTSCCGPSVYSPLERNTEPPATQAHRHTQQGQTEVKQQPHPFPFSGATATLRKGRQGNPALITLLWGQEGEWELWTIIWSYIIKQIKPPASMWMRGVCWAVGWTAGLLRSAARCSIPLETNMQAAHPKTLLMVIESGEGRGGILILYFLWWWLYTLRLQRAAFSSQKCHSSSTSPPACLPVTLYYKAMCHLVKGSLHPNTTIHQDSLQHCYSWQHVCHVSTIPTEVIEVLQPIFRQIDIWLLFKKRGTQDNAEPISRIIQLK